MPEANNSKEAKENMVQAKQIKILKDDPRLKKQELNCR
jgi:hypothetical protein